MIKGVKRATKDNVVIVAIPRRRLMLIRGAMQEPSK